MLTTAYKAITVTEKWGYIKKIINKEDYYSDETNEIFEKIKEFGYTGHSGCSFICTMNKMIFIAKYGEEKFKEQYQSC